MAPTLGGIQEKRKQLEVLQERVAHSETALEIFALLCGQAPDKGVNFGQYLYEREEIIKINGRSLTNKEFTTFLDNLRLLDRFVTAKEIYSGQVRERHKFIRNYGIEIPVINQEEKEKD